MTKEELTKIFNKKSDCQALISNHKDGWSLVKQVDAMTKDSFVKTIIELLENKKATINNNIKKL